MNKWLLTGIGLILGLFIGAAVMRSLESKPSRGTEEFEKTQNLESQITMLKTQNDQLQKDREECLSRFNRSTVLYDGTVFENRRWIIPADVEPVLLGAIGRASYTHYDPRTQTETVKMQPKAQ